MSLEYEYVVLLSSRWLDTLSDGKKHQGGGVGGIFIVDCFQRDKTSPVPVTQPWNFPSIPPPYTETLQPSHRCICHFQGISKKGLPCRTQQHLPFTVQASACPEPYQSVRTKGFVLQEAFKSCNLYASLGPFAWASFRGRALCVVLSPPPPPSSSGSCGTFALQSRWAAALSGAGGPWPRGGEFHPRPARGAPAGRAPIGCSAAPPAP